MELDRLRGSVRVSLLVLNDFGEQDAALTPNVAVGSSVRPEWLSLLNFKLAPLRFAKKGKPSFYSPKISPPKLNHQLGDANRVCLDLLCHFPRRSLRAKRQLLDV